MALAATVAPVAGYRGLPFTYQKPAHNSLILTPICTLNTSVTVAPATVSCTEQAFSTICVRLNESDYHLQISSVLCCNPPAKKVHLYPLGTFFMTHVSTYTRVFYVAALDFITKYYLLLLARCMQSYNCMNANVTAVVNTRQVISWADNAAREAMRCAVELTRKHHLEALQLSEQVLGVPETHNWHVDFTSRH